MKLPAVLMFLVHNIHNMKRIVPIFIGILLKTFHFSIEFVAKNKKMRYNGNNFVARRSNPRDRPNEKYTYF